MALSLVLINIKEFSADVVELSGLLTYKIFPGPPNYDSVEDGDYPEAGWILKLDDRSKDRLTSLTSDEDAADGEIAVEVERQYENVLQQYTNRNVICLGSLKDIYKEKEPHLDATIRKYRTVQTEGERQVYREVDFYNLKGILAVGYRIRSKHGTYDLGWSWSRKAAFKARCRNCQKLSEEPISGFCRTPSSAKENNKKSKSRS
jgi:hypothetical protein